jgi:hypothetical protein
MSMDTPRNERPIAPANLADYLALRKDVLVVQWMSAARKSGSIPSDALTRLELIDHVPKIFEATIEALRHRRTEEAMERVQEATARHTIVRWVQKYDLRAVLREVSLLRAVFIAEMHAFADARPQVDARSRLSDSLTIHRILDDVVRDATDTFLKLGVHENGTPA